MTKQEKLARYFNHYVKLLHLENELCEEYNLTRGELYAYSAEAYKNYTEIWR